MSTINLTTILPSSRKHLVALAFVFFVCLLPLPPAAHAESNTELVSDTVQARDLKAYAPLPRRGSGRWKLRTERDSFTGRKYTYAYLDAAAQIRGYWRKTRPRLYVRCLDKNLDIFIWFGAVMSCGDDVYDMRFDNSRIFSMDMTPAEDCRTMFTYDEAIDNFSFLRTMRQAKKLRVRANVHWVGPQVATFNLSGFSAIYKKVLAGCS